MSSGIHSLSSILSTDMNLYAGDPQLLKENQYIHRMEDLLQSDRADQLAARVAIHAQLREAFANKDVQQRLAPFLDDGEDIASYTRDPKAAAKFFSTKQQALQSAILASKEQRELKESHGELAAWEKENAVLLRHQMFMTYMPSQALLLESAATVALYRQYASLEEGQYTSESSDGEVPAMLRKLGGKSYFTQAEKPFEVDEHNKMFSQQVLQNKRVEYEQLREKTAELRRALEECPTVKRLEEFVRLRNDIFVEYGIDRLVSFCARRDKDLDTPNEGGVDPVLRNASSTNEYVTSCRVAQYSLPKIIEASYKNYLNILCMEDWDGLLKHSEGDARQVMEQLKPLKDRETFCYWLLACLTADCPQLGPNKIVGKNVTALEDFKRFWLPQRSNYVPTLNANNRTTFASRVADRRGLPQIVVLSPVTYSYRENNDPNSLHKGTIDLMVYDTTNEKVLLMITNSTDARKPRAAFLGAQEERYRFAAVVRSAITYDNQLHDFKCSGKVAEYFFDPQDGPEENFYCIMAPARLYEKSGAEVSVPIKALRPFTMCPPRYFVLGANWGVSSGIPRNPYPASYAHIQLNEAAIALVGAVPPSFVRDNVLPKLPTREEGEKMLEEAKKKESKPAQPASPRESSARTPRAASARSPRATVGADANSSSVSVAQEVEEQGPPEEEDPLSAVVPDDVFVPLRDMLLKQHRQWQPPAFLRAREKDPNVKNYPAVRDGQLRTPLNVFDELMRQKHNVETPAQSPPISSRRNSAAPNAASTSQRGGDRQKMNTAWF